MVNLKMLNLIFHACLTTLVLFALLCQDLQPNEFFIEEIEDIKLVSACTNSVQYAFDKPENERVFISFNLFKDKLEIIIKDNGKGFNINELDRTPLKIEH